jgi:chemotaxis protein CheD
MTDVLEIKTGELAIARDGIILKTGSVGSCLVIILYDKENRVGGLAHAMLPKGESILESGVADFSPGNSSGKYINEAIENLITGIRKEGGKRENLYARLAGGASMFKHLTGDKFGIGYQNITAAHEYLKNLNIPIQNEDTGGSSGKTVEFDLKTGIINVNTLI